MATRYWVGGTGTWDASSTTNWSTASGGAAGASAPTSVDTVIFDTSSGTGTCTTASGAACAIATLNSTTLTLKLGASLSMSGTFTLTQGTFDLNNQTLTCQIFSSSNSSVRSILFGTGNITLTGNAATILSMGTATNYTYTGTPTFICNYSGATGTRTIAFGSVSGFSESNVPSIQVTAGTDIVNFATFFKGIDFTGFAGTLLINSNVNAFGDVVFSSGMSFSGTSELRIRATTGTQKLTTNGKTISFPLVFGLTSGTATYELQDNCTIASTITTTLNFGTLNLNNKTFSAGLFSSSNSNIRAIAFGTGNVTLTGSGTVWNTGTATNFSYTGTPTVNISNNSATATTVSTGALSEAQALSFNYTTGTYALTDTNAVYKSLNFTGFTGTVPNSVRTIYGNLTLASGATNSAGANATTFAGTSGTQQITTNGVAVDYPLTFNGVGGTFAFQAALTQGSTRAFTITNGTVQLKAGATSTVGSFTTSGSTQKYLQSTVAGAQATLSQASGTVGVSYLTIKDIAASGGAVWNAYYTNNNVDDGNNTGWNFGGTPAVSTEVTYRLRSFTSPRRF